jgi:curved DNA-binding protein CbpA
VASAAANDPYATLGVSPSATDAELRTAYRRLVQLHHPDHNGGSAESAHRFEEIQIAYARARELRAGGAKGGAQSGARSGAPSGARSGAQSGTRANTPPNATGSVEDRLRAMEEELRMARQARERDLREARAARDRAAQQAREAAAATAGAAAGAGKDDLRKRATDEELGYYETDDSFAKILSDVSADITELFGKAMSAAERAAEEAAQRAADRRDHRD